MILLHSYTLCVLYLINLFHLLVVQ